MIVLWLMGCGGGDLDFIKVEEVRITPRSPYTSDLLQARVTVDSEGDVAPRLHYSWYVDGVEVRRGLGFDTLDGQVHFEKNEIVYVAVTASLGDDAEHAVTSSSVEILNTPPSPPEIYLSPDELQADEPVQCVIADQPADPDDDVLSYEFRWYLNDELVEDDSTEEGAWPGDTIRLQDHSEVNTIRCEVQALDGEESSSGAVVQHIFQWGWAMSLSDASFSYFGEDYGDLSGSSLLVQELDEQPWLLIGAPGAGDGLIYVVHGMRQGSQALAMEETRWDTELEGSMAGSTLCGLGDLDGDGLPETAALAQQAYANANSNTGLAWVIPGESLLGGGNLSVGTWSLTGDGRGEQSGGSCASHTGLSSSPALLLGLSSAEDEDGAAYLWSSEELGSPQDLEMDDSQRRFFSEAEGLKLGQASASADLDGDGVDEVILGDSEGVWIWSGAGLTEAGDFLREDASVGLSSVGRSLDGMVLWAGEDLSGGGKESLLVASPQAEGGQGTIWWIEGMESGSLSQVAGAQLYSTEEDASLGLSISAGDIQGDGELELALAGQQQVYILSAAQLTQQGSVSMEEAAWSFSREELEEALVPFLFDVNGDGGDDLLLGSPGTTPGGSGGKGSVAGFFNPE